MISRLFCALVLALLPQASDPGVEAYRLENGMRILVQEDHSIPSVALYIFYRIGSRNERPGTTGLSHFFEHMMFNGSKNFPPGMFDELMEAAGGSNNAYTSRDLTVCQDWFPPSALETVFRLEADRIQNLELAERMVESERRVVASERRTSVDGRNDGILNEQLVATAYSAHPYQWPVLGWMVDIESWTMEDLHRHFELGYSPQNATVVIVGDVNTAEVLDLARTHLEVIPSRGLPPEVRTREPEQQGERRLVVRKPAQLPLLSIAYHAPESNHPDYYPLRLLQTVLFDGESSRMIRRLVNQDQLTLSVDASYGLALDPTLFRIDAAPRQGVPPESVERVIYEELGRVVAGGVSEAELVKARNIRLADFYRDLKTINGKARALGNYEVFFGDFRKLFDAPAAYSAVTVADLERVAGTYFVDRNRTVATLLPEEGR